MAKLVDSDAMVLRRFQFISAPRFVRGITAALLCHVQHDPDYSYPRSAHHRKKRKFIMYKMSIIYPMPPSHFIVRFLSITLEIPSVMHCTQDPEQATRPRAHKESRAEHPCAVDTA